MKYVDTELLTKELDNLYDEWCGSSTGLEVAEEGASISTAESIFEEVHKIINSIQQEMWKPNEEQMKALSDAYVEASTFKIGDILESLYNDLQKLF